MATMLGDVADLHQRNQIKGFPLKVKWFRNIGTYQNQRGSIKREPRKPAGSLFLEKVYWLLIFENILVKVWLSQHWTNQRLRR